MVTQVGSGAVAGVVVGTGASHTFKLKPPGAVIVYGRGAALGSFKVFADTIEKELTPRYGDKIAVANIERKIPFLNYLAAAPLSFMINEIHVVSHAFGAGLALGYHDPVLQTAREAMSNVAASEGRSVTFYEVVSTEAGILFTDDIDPRDPFLFLARSFHMYAIRARLTNDAFIKVWGCNAGVENWIYSGSYWDVLNTQNSPKPSIAAGLAKFFNRPVYGANSGSHIEANVAGKWMKSDAYIRQYGNKGMWKLPHRLHPDAGDYHRYDP